MYFDLFIYTSRRVRRLPASWGVRLEQWKNRRRTADSIVKKTRIPNCSNLALYICVIAELMFECHKMQNKSLVAFVREFVWMGFGGSSFEEDEAPPHFGLHSGPVFSRQWRRLLVVVGEELKKLRLLLNLPQGGLPCCYWLTFRLWRRRRRRFAGTPPCFGRIRRNSCSPSHASWDTFWLERFSHTCHTPTAWVRNYEPNGCVSWVRQH